MPPQVVQTPRLVSTYAPTALTLDANQQQVASHKQGPMLVLAGPGTGKTATLAAAVAQRINTDHIPSQQILVLSFSRTAAAELRARITSLLQGQATPVVATFHSFAWAMLQTIEDLDLRPHTLLTGPMHDAMVRELLREPQSSWSQLWPATSRAALSTNELARQMITFMAAARARNMQPDDIRDLSQAAGIAEWAAAAEYFEEHLDVLDHRGALDYAELIFRATQLAAQDDRWRGKFQAIYVDEYQDTDPAQVALLQQLVTPATTFVVVGDPDQAIYRFRGADVRGILNFTQDFATGSEIPTVVLDTTRRFGPLIRSVADCWIEPVGMPGVALAAIQRHRSPKCIGPAGEVRFIRCASEQWQQDSLADLIRRARFQREPAIAWSDIAILVRSGSRDIPRISRTLLAAGVPVEIPGSDIPFGTDPAITPFVILAKLLDPDPRVHVSGEEVEGLLLSGLIGMTPRQIRLLKRALREYDRLRAAQEQRSVRSAVTLLAELFAEDHADLADVKDDSLRERIPDELGEPGSSPATQEQFLARLPADVAEAITELACVIADLRGAQFTPYEALWRMWQLVGIHQAALAWHQQLYQWSLGHGIRAHQADVALDSINEMFRLAQQAPTGWRVWGFMQHLASQQLPATRPEDAPLRRDAVRLMTAHRAKGGQWPLVVLVGLQEEQWPDVRMSTSLLAADRLGQADQTMAVTPRQLRDDERRLAFVAATRAQQELVITVVDEGREDGQVPSEFYQELLESDSVVVVEELVGMHHRQQEPTGSAPQPGWGLRKQLSPAAVVANLRAALADEQLSPELRQHAAAQLARLVVTDLGNPVARGATPAEWWGVNELTRGPQPLVDASHLPLSASAIDAVVECPLKWFLSRKLAAEPSRGTALATGSILHAIFAAVIRGHIPADVKPMLAMMDQVWDELEFGAPWAQATERANAETAIRTFLNWYQNPAYQSIAAETGFVLHLPGVSSATGPIVLRGSIDAIQRSPAGEYRVADFKTGKSMVTVKKAEESNQLAIYQLVLRVARARQLNDGTETADCTLEPALSLDGEPFELKGGVLVYVGNPQARTQQPTERSQLPLGDDSRITTVIAHVADTLIAERIEATPDPQICRRCSFKSMCPVSAPSSWLAQATLPTLETDQ